MIGGSCHGGDRIITMEYPHDPSPLTIELIPDPQIGGFTARVPGIPAAGQGETVDAAIADLKEALLGYNGKFRLTPEQAERVRPLIEGADEFDPRDWYPLLADVMKDDGESMEAYARDDAAVNTASVVTLIGKLVTPDDPAFTPEAARFLLSLRFSVTDHERMHLLSAKAREGSLNAAEHREIDAYIGAGHLLAILQSKARQSLKRQGCTP